MYDLNQILERLRHNEKIAKKFFAIEASILSINNFKDLFEKLLMEIGEKLDVPFVWMSIINQSDINHFVQNLEPSERLKNRLTVIDRKSFLDLIENDSKPLSLNEDLSQFYLMFPENLKYLIKSVAIAPITVNKEIIGSFNQGDTSRSRFSQSMDVTFLEQMAVKASICFSNVIAHAKVKTLSGMLPICSSCKNIRDDKGYWSQIEAYIRDHSEAEFSHSVCPECAKQLYPEFYKGD